MASTLACIEALVQETKKPEAEVMTWALETGARQLWREFVLGKYLRGRLSREEAIDEASLEWVELAERQHRAMLEDVAWAMGD